jgi:cardiolipin synthase
MWAWWSELWPYLWTGIDILLSVVMSLHVAAYKRDTRAVIAWIGVIWLAPPLLGPVLYLLFGINRIRRRALALRSGHTHAGATNQSACSPERLREVLGDAVHLDVLAEVGQRVTRRPLLDGNRIEPLINGDEAYPVMLQAIEDAERSVTLATYIFDDDRAGRQFLDALARAVERGVDVRVLVDDVGVQYSWPPIVRRLRRAGIRVARFLPAFGPRSVRYSNLRTHRKILVVDGHVGFTGGMNIREGNLHSLDTNHPIRDLHFRLEGPVVRDLQNVFAEDWAFCTRELIEGEVWFPFLEPRGTVPARAIPDGPDDNFEVLPMVLHGACSVARHRLAIQTPYFLPEPALITALGAAALRGVQVDILLPEKNNLHLVQWASTAMLWQVLQWGCRVWLTPPPFDHSKLVLVDEVWSLVGSANWDPRSLRLNFELNVECYDPEFAARMQSYFDGVRETSRRISLATVDARPMPIRIRDGLARLAAPYL